MGRVSEMRKMRKMRARFCELRARFCKFGALKASND